MLANKTHSLLLPAVALATVALVACSGQDAAQGGAPAGGGMPPPAVGVVTVAPQAVALQTELPGRVEPLRTAQIRARVTGVVLKREFREGSEVKAGQTLFTIDPAPYQAALESANAQLARAQATQKAAEADVAAGRAAVQTAKINLSYATVTTPIGGRIGRALVTEGALVSATEATQLALVQQTNAVYVNFTQSSTELLRLRKAMAANQLRKLGGDAVAVQVVLEDGSVLPKPGKLLFSDITVDATSGQITLRAEVPNPDGLLLPGQYVRVRLAQAELPAGILVPQQAVTRSNTGDTVLVVGEGNKPGPRPIKISGGQNGNWVVTDGLKPGDKVIVDGFQKMFVPGAPVNPVPWQPAGSAPAGAASAAAPASAAK